MASFWSQRSVTQAAEPLDMTMATQQCKKQLGQESLSVLAEELDCVSKARDGQASYGAQEPAKPRHTWSSLSLPGVSGRRLVLSQSEKHLGCRVG